MPHVLRHTARLTTYSVERPGLGLLCDDRIGHGACPNAIYDTAEREKSSYQ